MTEQESLEIIRTMVDRAKGNVGEDSIFYLLWGWLVLIASIIHFTFIQIDYANAWLPWPILMIIGGVASAIIGAKKSKKQKTKGYIDRLMSYLWSGFVITLFILLFHATMIGWHYAYSIMISLYGLATFISGGVLKFKPLIFGGICAWIIAIISFHLSMEWIVLMVGLSMICSYLIPGYMLKNKYHG